LSGVDISLNRYSKIFRSVIVRRDLHAQHLVALESLT